jgi:SAM-dependent methyltransferase
LAKTAKIVIGVDIDERTVSHAQMKYKSENLEFKIGSATNIPIDVANTFDVVVSFETIEHLDDESQQAFIKEIKRMLKPLGLFIVSTPNRLTYSEIPQYVNEFHKKEFYESEFETFMKGYFQKVIIVGQKIQASSYIWPKNENTGMMVEYNLTNAGGEFSSSFGTKDMTYIIAICSDRELDDASFSVLFDESESLVHEQLRVALTELSKREEALKSIYASKGWKLLKTYYNIRDRVLRRTIEK